MTSMGITPAEPKKKIIRGLFLLSVFIMISGTLRSQQTPFNPISYRVYNPFIMNPAVAGSKDYFLVDGIASFQGKYKSQLITGDIRLSKKTEGFFPSVQNSDYTSFGVGGTIFNDVSDTSKSTGFSIAAAYHIRINKQSTTFISFGASVKGIYNRLYTKSVADDGARPQETYLPNVDIGVYLYGSRFSAGLSATNILGSEDSLGIPVKPEYFLTAGYKFVLSRSLDIVLEPSLIAHTGDSLSGELKDILNPMVKLYIENICIGTYFNDYGNNSFFFRYNFPAVSIGTYFEYPKGTPFYKKELIAEFTLGLNLSRLRFRNKNALHW